MRTPLTSTNEVRGEVTIVLRRFKHFRDEDKNGGGRTLVEENTITTGLHRETHVSKSIVYDHFKVIR